METTTPASPTERTNPRASTQVDVTEFEDRFMAYDRDRDQVHVLNRSAAEVLDLCDGNRSEIEIAEALQRSYSLDTPPLREVSEILARMKRTGLIAFHNPALKAV